MGKTTKKKTTKKKTTKRKAVKKKTTKKSNAKKSKAAAKKKRGAAKKKARGKKSKKLSVSLSLSPVCRLVRPVLARAFRLLFACSGFWWVKRSGDGGRGGAQLFCS